MKRPLFWIVLVLVAAGATWVATRYFPRAFSLVTLDLSMDRAQALEAARAIMARDGLGPAGYRQVASFDLDDEAQTFVELEGGGKEAFTAMMRGGLYSAYRWRVRQFKQGETNETSIRFTPDGQPYGFFERIAEETPGPALTPDDARRLAEQGASANWRVDFRAFAAVEQGQERRPNGRVDHTFTYERPTPRIGEGSYRLRLRVTGDRLTEVAHFVKIPEAFTRRYEGMRSANEAIGVGSVVGLTLLYLIGGIGVGLFYLARRRWVLWRPAMYWGVGIAFLQLLASLNSWPLAWLSYDTALPSSTFVATQLMSILGAFFGFAALFTLSFMAAESLTRRAFGSHPQLWRAWARGVGNSTAIAGATAAGYLLVPVFLAYDVVLYLVATRTFGWWTPSEALLQPNALATYVPWLDAIANSLQAGFWEECLFRAVPLAGAALIGERLGHRRLFLVVAFIVQAVIFGAGHAPYPTQPSFARPVELIIPSIGFGLLYVYFGLVPGIVLHFAFDVVWFALPIFQAKAPGIWLQQAMLIVATLVPLWIVLVRRWQAGRWAQLEDNARNAAWQPAPVAEVVDAPDVQREYHVSRRVEVVWLALGAAGVVAAIAATALAPRADVVASASRADAAAAARGDLLKRGVSLERGWRVMPVPDDGSGGDHEFVATTAGEARRQELVGQYLPRPIWRVRVATFEGDVAARAEEWLVRVDLAGGVRSVWHTVPEGRAGPSLDEAAARAIAVRAVAERLSLDAARGQIKEVSATPAKLPARTDWTFTFTDTTIAPLPLGEPRLSVHLAGDEVTSIGRFVYVPETWRRDQRATDTRNSIIQFLAVAVLGSLLVSSAIAGVMAWTRGQQSPRLVVAGTLMMLLVSAASTLNGWPTLLASLQTSQPLRLQLAVLAGASVIGLLVTALLVGLVLGGIPHRLASASRLARRQAALLGAATGAVGAGVLAVASYLRTPRWSDFPGLSPLGTVAPFLQVALQPVPGLLTRMAIALTFLVWLDHVTHGWTTRRWRAAGALLLFGVAVVGAPTGAGFAGWLAAGLVVTAALSAAYIVVLRADLTMMPIALGTMTAFGALAAGVRAPYPGAIAASIAAMILIGGVAWWWFQALRRRPA